MTSVLHVWMLKVVPGNQDYPGDKYSGSRFVVMLLHVCCLLHHDSELACVAEPSTIDLSIATINLSRYLNMPV